MAQKKSRKLRSGILMPENSRPSAASSNIKIRYLRIFPPLPLIVIKILSRQPDAVNSIFPPFRVLSRSSEIKIARATLGPLEEKKPSMKSQLL